MAAHLAVKWRIRRQSPGHLNEQHQDLRRSGPEPPRGRRDQAFHSTAYTELSAGEGLCVVLMTAQAPYVAPKSRTLASIDELLDRVQDSKGAPASPTSASSCSTSAQPALCAVRALLDRLMVELRRCGDTVHAILARIDYDRSGKLDRNQLRTELIKLGMPLTISELDSVLKIFDRNRDGTVVRGSTPSYHRRN